MRKIIAIARLAISNAIRSRIVLSLVAVLLVVLVGLPLTIQSDGTLAGQVRILLSYTLGFSIFILSLAAAWSGCAAVSLEIQDRQAHLLVTKPVYRLQIWLGKWLGLLAMYGVLLLFCGLAVYVSLMWTLRPERLSADARATLREEILVARQSARPDLSAVDETTRKLFQEQETRGLPPDITRQDAYAACYHAALREYFSVQPGHTRTWRIPLSAPINPEHDLVLAFRFSSSHIGPEPVPATWRVGSDTEPIRWELNRTDNAGQLHTLRIPGAAVAGQSAVLVSYANLSQNQVTVLFDPASGLSLQIYAGRFESNLARALILVFCGLAFLAAVGLSAGSLLSAPVASFTSVAALLFLQFGDYIERMSRTALIFEHHSHDAQPQLPTFWDHAFQFLFKIMDIFLHPLQGAHPLEWLSSGQLIAWPAVGAAFLFKVVIYSGALALLASWLLGRREIGMPA